MSEEPFLGIWGFCYCELDNWLSRYVAKVHRKNNGRTTNEAARRRKEMFTGLGGFI